MDAVVGAVDNVKVDIFDTHRAWCMYANIFLEILSILLLLVAFAGNSKDKVVGYVGTRAYASKGSGHTVSMFEDCDSSLCDDCKSAGESAIFCTVVGFIMVVVMLVLSFMRRTGEQKYYKFGAVVCGFFGLLFFICAMGAWDDQCVEEWPTSNGVKYEMGNGMNCVLTSFFFTLFGFVTHLCVSTSNNDKSPVVAPI